MGWLLRTTETSVGKKGVMAATGIILVLYAVVHMLGNTHLWEHDKGGGLTAMDFYARLLRTFPGLLWAFRAVMFVAAVLHVVTGVRLWLENRRARPQGYVRMATVQASWASRTMIWTGSVIFLFVIYHLLNLTFGTVGPVSMEEKQSMVFGNVVNTFRDPVLAALYIIGMVFLYFHLSHGIASLFQTLGFRHPKYIGAVQKGASALAFVICGVNILFPVSVLLGWVG